MFKSQIWICSLFFLVFPLHATWVATCSAYQEINQTLYKLTDIDLTPGEYKVNAVPRRLSQFIQIDGRTGREIISKDTHSFDLSADEIREIVRLCEKKNRFPESHIGSIAIGHWEGDTTLQVYTDVNSERVNVSRVAGFKKFQEIK